MKCQDCRFWSLMEVERLRYPDVVGWGYSACTRFDADEDLKDEGTLAWVYSEDAYVSTRFFTRGSFFCALFEGRPQP